MTMARATAVGRGEASATYPLLVEVSKYIHRSAKRLNKSVGGCLVAPWSLLQRSVRWTRHPPHHPAVDICHAPTGCPLPHPPYSYSLPFKLHR